MPVLSPGRLSAASLHANALVGAPNERVLSANDIALLDMGAECVARSRLPFGLLLPHAVAGTFATAATSRVPTPSPAPFLPTSASSMKPSLKPKNRFLVRQPRSTERNIPNAVSCPCSHHEAGRVVAGHASPHVARPVDGNFLLLCPFFRFRLLHFAKYSAPFFLAHPEDDALFPGPQSWRRARRRCRRHDGCRARSGACCLAPA